MPDAARHLISLTRPRKIAPGRPASTAPINTPCTQLTRASTGPNVGLGTRKRYLSCSFCLVRLLRLMRFSVRWMSQFMTGQVLKLRFPNCSLTECPNCTAKIPFRRSPVPIIDSCGFETSTVVCPGCGTSFSGVIDPADDVFLPQAT
jgi:hypothetical protein